MRQFPSATSPPSVLDAPDARHELLHGTGVSEWREYRAQARSFQRQASEARRDAERDELLTLARQWEKLADEVEFAEQRVHASLRTRI
jgi:hypothetical protein